MSRALPARLTPIISWPGEFTLREPARRERRRVASVPRAGDRQGLSPSQKKSPDGGCGAYCFHSRVAPPRW